MSLVLEVKVPSCCALKLQLMAEEQEITPARAAIWCLTAGLSQYFEYPEGSTPPTETELCDRSQLAEVFARVERHQ